MEPVNSKICTQRITSITQKPAELPNYVAINVLKWKDSKWKTLCPYVMRTDGEEFRMNDGGILFENYWQ